MIRPDRALPRSVHHPFPTRRIHQAAWLLVTQVSLSTCSAPTDAGPAAITLRLHAPASVLLNQQALLTVQAVDGRGAEVALPEPPVWSTSDSSVARITPAGGLSAVLSGVARGDLVVSVHAGTTSATATIRVRTRLRIAPPLPVAVGAPVLTLAIGDSVHFVAQHVDANGEPVDDAPPITWTSSNPAGVSVSDAGLVVGREAWAAAVVRASSSDGLDSVRVRLRDVVAGQPATIRFAHAVRDAPPVTFLPSKGDPVTLAFGESVERPILSGFLLVTITWAVGSNPVDQGSYDGQPLVLRGGDRLELYAVETPPGLIVGGRMIYSPTWGNTASIPKDTALVRFIQATPFLVFDVQPPGKPMSATPWHCYFDPGDWTDYAPLAAGEFDLILTDKFPRQELARIRATAPSGRAVTYVIIGDRGATTELLAFPDP